MSTGTIFGQAVTADTPTALVTGLTNAAGLAIDGAGNLYVDYYGTVEVLSNSSSSLDGTAVTPDVLTPIAVGLLGDLGATFHRATSTWPTSSWIRSTSSTTPTATISSVDLRRLCGQPDRHGHGHRLHDVAPDLRAGLDSSGQDYKYGNLYLNDTTPSWGAGIPGDCIGLTAAKITATKAVFGLGSFYPGNFSLNAGDGYTVGVDGTTFSGTVTYASPSSATITKVKPAEGPGGGGHGRHHQGHRPDGDQVRLLRQHAGQGGDSRLEHRDHGDRPGRQRHGRGRARLHLGRGRHLERHLHLRRPDADQRQPGQGLGARRHHGDAHRYDLTGTSAVEFGSTAATSFTVVSDTEVKAVSPAEAAGTVSVTVTTPAGTSNGVNYKFK